MTRVNTIHTSLLTNNQLLAEYREIPRIINKVSKGKLYSTIPPHFIMGRGHESFFGDKLLYIHNRHRAILRELECRKSRFPEVFKSDYIIDTTANFKRCQVLFKELCNDWTPSIEDHSTSLDRLIERQFLQTKVDKYNNKKIDKSRIMEDWLKYVMKFYKNQTLNFHVQLSFTKWYEYSYPQIQFKQ